VVHALPRQLQRRQHALHQPLLRQLKKVTRAYTAGKEAASNREFEDAVAQFTLALEESKLSHCAPFTVQLYTSRGEAHLRLKQFKESLMDCQMALRGDDGFKKAWMTRFSVLHLLERHDEVMNDVRPLLEKFPHDSEFMHVANRAEFETRKAARPRYYEALGVSSVASVPEIKQAYKRRALELHPDKQADKPVEEQRAAEAEFKTCNDALEVLCETMKRQLYDQGYDYAAIQERVQNAQKKMNENPGCCHGGR